MMGELLKTHLVQIGRPPINLCLASVEAITSAALLTRMFANNSY